MGLKMTGTDFVTAGPDKLLAVLRDPPGSRSYSFIEEGSTFRSSSTYKTSVDQAANAAVIALTGSSETSFTGTGTGVIVKISETKSEVGLGVVHEEHFNYSNKKEKSKIERVKWRKRV